MASVGRFISPGKIKQTAFVDENVDEKYLSDTIVFTQELYTKEILGTALYDEIKGQIENDTLSSDNNALLTTYIPPALQWWVLYEGMDMLHIKITNKSVVKKKSENSDPVTLAEILHLKEKFRNLAERWDEKTRLYLIENSTTYPLYLSPGSGTDTIHPKGLTYGTSWYLGDSSDTCGGIEDMNNP